MTELILQQESKKYDIALQVLRVPRPHLRFLLLLVLLMEIMNLHYL